MPDFEPILPGESLAEDYLTEYGLGKLFGQTVDTDSITPLADAS